jgi:hypothetical protein
MTEHEKITSEAMRQVYNDAVTNALLYGVGLVRVSYCNGILDFSCVDREEFRDTADQLIWLDNNARRETKQ